MGLTSESKADTFRDLPSNPNILIRLALSQSLQTSSLVIASILGTLTWVQIAPQYSGFAGLPAFISLIFAAATAYGIGKRISQWGYAPTLFAGSLSGLIGHALACWSHIHHLWQPFLLAYAFTGLSLGCLGFTRFAAAENETEPSKKTRVMGRVVLASTLGAILGPWLISLGEGVFHRLLWPAIFGPWVMGGFFFGVAAALIFPILNKEWALSRSNQSLKLNTLEKHPRYETSELPSAPKAPRWPFILAITGSASAQIAMIFIMSMTPLHMRHCHFPTTAISWVISLHVFGMYGLSTVTSRMIEVWGYAKTMALGGVVLIMACTLAPFSHNQGLLMAALFLLGYGWNLCYLGASSAIALAPEGKPRQKLQGLNEAATNLSSSLTNISGGWIYSLTGFNGIAFGGWVFSFLPFLALLQQKWQRPDSNKNS